MLTAPKVAEKLGISDETVFRLIRSGQLVGVERSLTGRYRLPQDAAEQIRRHYESRSPVAA